MSVQFNAKPTPRKRWVYVGGTDAIVDGSALCYDTTASKGAADPRDELGTLAIKPATAHLFAFAGVVVEGGGKTAPDWFEVYEPVTGAIVDALVGVNTVAGATALGPVNGEYHLAAHADATLNQKMAATGMETDATLTATPAVVRTIME